MLSNESVKEIEGKWQARLTHPFGSCADSRDPQYCRDCEALADFSSLLEDRRELQKLLGENSQAEREVIDAQASSSPDRSSKTVAELEAELASLREQLKAIINDQCWVKKIDMETLLPRADFIHNCYGFYDDLKNGKRPDINLEAELLRGELVAVREQLAEAFNEGIEAAYEYLQRMNGFMGKETCREMAYEIRALKRPIGEQSATPDRSSVLANLEVFLDEYGSCYFITEYDEHERLQNRIRIANRIISLFEMASPSGGKGVE